jgi:hypothetical protein
MTSAEVVEQICPKEDWWQRTSYETFVKAADDMMQVMSADAVYDILESVYSAMGDREENVRT